MRIRGIMFFFTLGLLFLLPPVSFADSEIAVFGPEKYVRSTGKPQTVVKNFSVDTAVTECRLTVENGKDKSTRATSVIIALNGNSIVGPNDLNKQVEFIERPVVVEDNNEIAVEVRGGPDTFIVVTVLCLQSNVPPIADAGIDSNTLTSIPLTLDGSDSYDPDGDLITFRWTLASAPPGSAASLSDATQPDPRFIPDVSGDYVYELIVNDGQIDSTVDSVMITASTGYAPPNARAGPDKNARVNTIVTLDGSSSYDPNGFPLNYSWSFTAKPSTSLLSDADIVARDTSIPQFSPDAAGTYTLNLAVDNGIDMDADTVQVLASAPNVGPNADAGSDLAVKVAVKAVPDGSGSSDPDSGPDPLSFAWELVSRPVGSALTNEDIVDANKAMAGVTPDTEGSYVARLKVSDGDKEDADNVLLVADNVSPEIEITVPVDGSRINNPTPYIDVIFSDNHAGIDPNSFNAELNGQDISDLFSVTEWSATYQNTENLPADNYELVASIRDSAGNLASATTHFEIAYLRAIPGANPTTGFAPLQVRFTTDGEDPAGTIEVFRWDFDGDGVYDTYDTVANDYDYTYQTPGTYQAKLFVQSSTGQTATDSITITVQNNPPVATADVVPSNGAVPLSVNLLGSGSDSDGQIVLYEWDFEGDGTYDWSSSSTGNTSYTYVTEGTYQAVFRVTDDSGQTATAVAVTTVIRAGPEGSPTATASASPSSGDAPLVVNFNCTATDPDNAIVLYEWDFDSDGTYDWSSTTGGNASHTYIVGGTHVATCRVMDETGLIGIDQLLITVDIQLSLSIEKNTVGFLSGSGMTATASSEYSASYSAGQAIDGNTGTLWYTAYGETPAAGSNTFFEVQFGQAQKVSGMTVYWNSGYQMTRARIEVYDDGGNLVHSQEETFTSATSQVNLPDVENVRRIRLVGLESTSTSYVSIIELEVNSTPMPGSNLEPTGTDINTTLSAATPVTILIKDSQGNTVRTLVNNENRGQGVYSDYWDTRDDSGLVVNDGVYYVVLNYILNGKSESLDLTYTTGGQRYSFPFGSGCDTRANISQTLPNVRPFEDKLLALTFTLCSAQEVTAFIGPLWTGLDQTRIRTIANRQKFPAGTHTLYWDGLDDNGNIAQAPPGDNLITGFWRYELPANAIFMTGGKPEITAISATPNYFSPFSEKCDANGNGEGIEVDYSVSENATSVELRVYSVETGSLLRTIVVGNVPGGDNFIFWDGKNNNGEYVDIGDYRVGLIATDGEGNDSMVRYALVRVDY